MTSSQNYPKALISLVRTYYPNENIDDNLLKEFYKKYEEDFRAEINDTYEFIKKITPLVLDYPPLSTKEKEELFDFFELNISKMSKNLKGILYQKRRNFSKFNHDSYRFFKTEKINSDEDDTNFITIFNIINFKNIKNILISMYPSVNRIYNMLINNKDFSNDIITLDAIISSGDTGLIKSSLLEKNDFEQIDFNLFDDDEYYYHYIMNATEEYVPVIPELFEISPNFDEDSGDYIRQNRGEKILERSHINNINYVHILKFLTKTNFRFNLDYIPTFIKYSQNSKYLIEIKNILINFYKEDLNKFIKRFNEDLNKFIKRFNEDVKIDKMDFFYLIKEYSMVIYLYEAFLPDIDQSLILPELKKIMETFDKNDGFLYIDDDKKITNFHLAAYRNDFLLLAYFFSSMVGNFNKKDEYSNDKYGNSIYDYYKNSS